MKHIAQLVKSYTRREDGVSAVEFSLVAPVFFLLLIGTLDLGMYIYHKQQINNIANAGAEYLAKGGTPAQFEETVISYYANNPSKYSHTVNYVGMCRDKVEQKCTSPACTNLSCNGKGDYKRRYVSVAITRTFQAILPYPGIANELELTGRVRLRVN